MVVAYERRGVVSGAARTLSRRSGAGGAADIGRARTAGWSALEYSSTFSQMVCEGVRYIETTDISLTQWPMLSSVITLSY